MQQFDVTAEDGTTRDVDTLVFMDNGCVRGFPWLSVGCTEGESDELATPHHQLQ